ncbi:signal peptidase II [Paenibacillus filicis]|uniref:Lipoprotein signal peptidase n=1 Tax=Paenibacillus filicis TaxID=669464 RepID=A0ABU9DNA5_9BACL
MRFYIAAALALLLDQLTKVWVRGHMTLGESYPVLNGLYHFTYYRNSGAAGSTFQGYGRYFIIPAVLFVAYVLYARWKGEMRGAAAELGSGLLVGGAVGNALDRAIFGWVTDFIDNGRGILNVADYAINAGVLLLIGSTVYAYIQSRRAKRNSQPEPEPETAP